MNPRLRDQLVEALGVKAHETFHVNGPLDLADLWQIVNLPGFKQFRDRPGRRSPEPRLQGDDGRADVFAAMRAGDLLVHHPHGSGSPPLRRALRRAGGAHPDALADRAPVHRTSDDSPLSRRSSACRARSRRCSPGPTQGALRRARDIEWVKKYKQGN